MKKRRKKKSDEGLSGHGWGCVLWGRESEGRGQEGMGGEGGATELEDGVLSEADS